MRSMVNPGKFIPSFISTCFFGGFGIFYVVHSRWIESVVFLLLAVLFGYIAFINGSSVAVDKDGVRSYFFVFSKKKWTWDQVKEVGILGENVFSRNKKKPGYLYFYFSPKEMTEKERFDLAVRWPPKDVLYMLYSEDRTATIQYLWGKKLALYNVGDLDFDTAPTSSDEQED